MLIFHPRPCCVTGSSCPQRLKRMLLMPCKGWALLTGCLWKELQGWGCSHTAGQWLFMSRRTAWAKLSWCVLLMLCTGSRCWWVTLTWNWCCSCSANHGCRATQSLNKLGYLRYKWLGVVHMYVPFPICFLETWWVMAWLEVENIPSAMRNPGLGLKLFLLGLNIEQNQPLHPNSLHYPARKQVTAPGTSQLSQVRYTCP